MTTNISALKMTFLGAAQEVTGSKTLLQYRDRRILVDCGLYQGDRELRSLNWEDLSQAQNIEAVLLTHAHIDHCGFLPRIVRQGFAGKIYCTAATAALIDVMLKDAARLQEEDADYANETGHSSHRPANPLYTYDDVVKTLRHVKIIERDRWYDLGPGLSCRFLRSGHLIGSSFIQVSFDTGEAVRTITFSGDLGSDRSHTIKGPVDIEESDYLVLEGTYGDKVHPAEDVLKPLARAINHVIEKKGVLIIPSFAVGRTQEVLHLIHVLEKESAIPHVPVYVDSPMALRATDIYSRFKDDLRPVIDGKKISDSLEGIHFTAIASVQQSQSLNAKDGPMIIISAAGMLSGGRILHHLKTRLPQRRNTVLFVGFQARGTKGRLLQNGIDRINIHHEVVDVNAEILTLDGLSAHADSRELVDWVRRFNRRPTKVFLNHGEMEPLRALKYRLKHELGIEEVEIPVLGQEFELN